VHMPFLKLNLNKDILIFMAGYINPKYPGNNDDYSFHIHSVNPSGAYSVYVEFYYISPAPSDNSVWLRIDALDPTQQNVLDTNYLPRFGQGWAFWLDSRSNGTIYWIKVSYWAWMGSGTAPSVYYQGYAQYP